MKYIDEYEIVYMIMQENWSIDPTKSCEAQCDIKDKFMHTERYYQIDETPLKDLTDDDLVYMMSLDSEMDRHHKAIYRIEWYRRNFVHIIDNLKSSLENGEVNIFEMAYLKKHIMQIFDRIYDDDLTWDIIEEVNSNVKFKR